MSTLPYRSIYPKVPDSVFIAPGASVIGDVEIGERSSIWFNTVVRGDVHYIRVGSETNVQDNCTLHVTPGKFPLVVGNRVTVGHRAIVHGCVIEDECLIGMGSIILDGVKVGKGSLIAAGSILTPGLQVPPDSLVMGAPAQIKRSVSDSEKEMIRRAWSHYIELAAEYLDPEELRGKTRIKGFLG